MAVSKRSVPSRWDERRERQAQRSAAHWAGERERTADQVDLAAIVWDQLRCGLRGLDRKSFNRMERAGSPGEKEAAIRQREQALQFISRTCSDVVAYLDHKITEVREQS